MPQLQTKNQGSVLHVRYFDGGNKFLTAYYTGIEVYDSHSLKQLYSIPLDGWWYDQKTIEVSNRYQQLFIMTDQIFSVYSLKSGALRFRKFFDDYFHIAEMTFSPTEEKMTIKGERRDGWYADTYDLKKHQYTISTDPIDTIIRSPEDYSCYSQDKQYELKHNYELFRDGKAINKIDFKFYDRNPLQCAFSPDNTQMIIAGSQFSVYDINKSRTRMPQILAQEPIQMIGFARDKMLLQGDNLYIGWDLKEGKELWRNISYRTMCHDCSPAPDHVLLNHQDRAFIKPSYAGGFGVFVGGTGGLLDMDMNTGLLKPLPVNYVGSLRLSDDDKRLIVGSGDGNVRIYNTNGFASIWEFKGGAGQAYVGGYERPVLLVSGDGKHIIQKGAVDGINNPIHYYTFESNQTIAFPSANLSKNKADFSIARKHYCNGRLALTEFNYHGTDLNQTLGSECTVKIEYLFRGDLIGMNADGSQILLRSYRNPQEGYIVYDLVNQKNVLDKELVNEKIISSFLSKNGQYLCLLNNDGLFREISLKNGLLNRSKEFKNAKSIREISNNSYLIGYKDGKHQIIDNKSLKSIVSFYLKSFESGEWLFLTDQGFFNASSKRVLANLVIEDMGNKRELNSNEIKKYFRPDIVNAILLNKPYQALLKTKENFLLEDKAEYKNQYMESLRQMYLKDGNIYILSTLASSDKPEYLPHIMKAISEMNETEAMDGLYRALGRYEQSLTRDFVFDRIIQTFNTMDDNNTFNNDIYSILQNFKSNEVKMKISEKLQKTNCLKFENDWYKRKIEKDLNITLPCGK